MRLFANISLYFFTFGLTGSKFAAILSTIIFLFSAAGLQTTDWVFNMNTYAGLGFLSLASVFYLKIRKLNTIYSFNYILFIVTFLLALAIVPTRMHGAVPFLIIMDLFLTFVAEKRENKINRYLVIRIITSILVFVLLLHVKSFGEGSFTTDRLSESSQVLQELNHKGYYAVWFYFLGIIGHLVLPDSVSLDNFTSVVFLTNGISIIMGIVISWSLARTKNFLFYLPIFIFNFIWGLVLGWLVSINPNPLYNLNPYPPSDVLFAIALGGQLIFWSIWLSILTRKTYPHLSSSFIISLIWIITMTIIYWLFTPYYLIETTGRYMLMGSAGIAIFLGGFINLIFSQTISLQKNENTRVLSSFYLLLTIFIFLFWISTNFQKSQAYLGILEQTRNRELTERTWNTLVRNVPKLDPIGPSVFYFTTDNPLSLQGVLVFGFFMRAGMTYRIPEQDLTPLPSTNYQELISYVTDGSPLQKIHGRKAIPVPLSRIYAFDFRNGELINITTVVRNKLTADLKAQSK